MGMCKYSYYDLNEKFYPRLYCKADDGYCINSKRCTLVEKYIPLDNFNEKECYKYCMEEKKKIPQDSFYVQTYRKRRNGKLFLYVDINDKLEKYLPT